MAKKITFLGIETSCDETAAAVIRENDNGTADILSNIVSSQIEEHKKFGGVVPELAARAHLENIEYIIETALKESKINIENFDNLIDAFKRVLILTKKNEFTKKIILFSPSAASFDSFKNFEDRGVYFNKLVKRYLYGK